jgi:hypothetical protein
LNHVEDVNSTSCFSPMVWDHQRVHDCSIAFLARQ